MITYIVEARDFKQNRWREVFNSVDKGEARLGLWNYVEEHPGKPVRVREESED